LAVAMEELRGGRAIAYVGLLYPLVDPSQSSPSALTYADGHMLTSDFVAYAWRAYGGEPPSCRADARFDLRLADWRGFAPTTIVAAECDPLHDEGHGLAAAMTNAGVPVELHTFSGMIHGFAGLPQFTPQAEEALALLADRLARGLGTWTATRPSTGEEE
ncbi:MAG: alpha/beta hydrolase fold domain-containing protein, partial [Novosphingobium sp.]